jgi:hypothetical protein
LRNQTCQTLVPLRIIILLQSLQAVYRNASHCFGVVIAVDCYVILPAKVSCSGGFPASSGLYVALPCHRRDYLSCCSYLHHDAIVTITVTVDGVDDRRLIVNESLFRSQFTNRNESSRRSLVKCVIAFEAFEKSLAQEYAFCVGINSAENFNTLLLSHYLSSSLIPGSLSNAHYS